MKFQVIDEWNCDEIDFDTLEEAREFAIDRIENIGDESEVVTIALIVPMEEYRWVPPVEVQGSVACTCVATQVRTCTR